MANDKSKNFKLLALAAVILIFVIIYIGYTYLSSRNKGAAAYTNLSGINSNSAGKETLESENYKEILETYNKSNADNAVNDGKTYISVLSGEKENIVIPEKVEHTPQIIKEPAKPPVSAPPPQPRQRIVPNNKQMNKNENKNLIAQTQALMSAWNNPATHSSARVSDDAQLYVESISYKPKSQSSNYNQEELDKIVDDYDLVPAILMTELDSDENSLVKAFVPNGKYKGALLFADGYKLLYETIDLTFTRMAFKGETYDIIAKPIDQDTMRTSLSGDVNTRWFQKVILPAIASGFGEVGELYKNSNRKILQNNFSTYESTARYPSPDAVAGVMIGGAGSNAAKIIQQDVSKIPLKEVIVSKNTVIGIQFIGPVYKSDSIDYKKNKELKSSINNTLNSTPTNYDNKQINNQALPINNY